MPCLRHRSLADIPAACSFSTLMICSSVDLLLRIVRLLGGEQNPNSKPGAFQGSRSADCTQPDRSTFVPNHEPSETIVLSTHRTIWRKNWLWRLSTLSLGVSAPG